MPIDNIPMHDPPFTPDHQRIAKINEIVRMKRTKIPYDDTVENFISWRSSRKNDKDMSMNNEDHSLPPKYKEKEICNERCLARDMNVCIKPDNVNHPKHYTWLWDLCGIEVIDITRHLDFDLGNAVKYILRAGHKSEEGMSDREKTIEDLEKAVWYLNDEIGQLKAFGKI